MNVLVEVISYKCRFSSLNSGPFKAREAFRLARVFECLGRFLAR